ncbi:MAG: hypothetical protein ACI9HI_001324 [Salinirussus sp.]|jgi:hypothetical protein
MRASQRRDKKPAPPADEHGSASRTVQTPQTVRRTGRHVDDAPEQPWLSPETDVPSAVVTALLALGLPVTPQRIGTVDSAPIRMVKTSFKY